MQLRRRAIGGFHGSPNYLEDAVTGPLLREDLASLGDSVVIKAVSQVGPGRFLVRASLRRASVSRTAPRGTVAWEELLAAYRDFVSKVSKRRCPYAVHTVAVYEAGGGSWRWWAMYPGTPRP